MKICISHFLIRLLTTAVTVKILLMTIPLKKIEYEMPASGQDAFVTQKQFHNHDIINFYYLKLTIQSIQRVQEILFITAKKLWV